jgi:photosystem II stability/assembly factor-like uncharacterized protein
VSIANPAVSWALNASNQIVETMDGGSSWSQVSMSGLPTGTTWTALAGSGSSTAWVVGASDFVAESGGVSGVVARTVDGKSWQTRTFLPSALWGGDPPSHLTLTSVSLTPSDGRCGASQALPSVWVGGYGTGGGFRGPDNVLISPVSLESPVSASPLDAFPFNWNTTSAVISGSTNGGPLIAGFDATTAWAIAVPNGFGAFPNPDLPSALDVTIGINATASGNAGWRTSSLHLVTPISINALDSSNCQSGYAVGNAGTILATTDSARTWSSQSSTTSGVVGAANLVSVSAMSSHRAYALEQIVQEPSQTPYIVEQFTVFATSDGGLNWSAQTPVVETAWLFNGVPRVATPQVSTNGVTTVAVGPGFITHTPSASGAAWNLGEVCPANVCTNDESRMVFPWGNACGSSGPGVVSGTILIAPCAPVELWTSVSLTANAAWVTDIWGDILEADPNDLPNWSFVSYNPTLPTWVSVTGTNYQYPTDVGPSPDTSVTISGIAAIDPISAVVVGSGGLVSWTNNRGVKWNVASSGTTSSLSAISIATTGSAIGTGWAVGSNGTVLKTTDRGQHWMSQSWSDGSVNFTSVSTPEGMNVWATGKTSLGRPIVINSSDGGKTWAVQPTGAHALVSVKGIDASTAWVVGPDGAILKTLTGGRAPASE